MKIERLSHKKIRLSHTVPIYYRCGTFVSDKIGERKVNELWCLGKDNGSDIYFKSGYKNKFMCSLSVNFSHKKKDIYINYIANNFDFENKVLNLVITKNFFFDINEKQLRDYKIENLLNERFI